MPLSQLTIHKHLRPFWENCETRLNALNEKTCIKTGEGTKGNIRRETFRSNFLFKGNAFVSSAFCMKIIENKPSNL